MCTLNTPCHKIAWYIIFHGPLHNNRRTSRKKKPFFSFPRCRCLPTGLRALEISPSPQSARLCPSGIRLAFGAMPYRAYAPPRSAMCSTASPSSHIRLAALTRLSRLSTTVLVIVTDNTQPDRGLPTTLLKSTNQITRHKLDRRVKALNVRRIGFADSRTAQPY